ncbi:hypothetical protein B0H12DRAFT_1232522 [Mycena haematopus]|nr:hypothetical protein B0H12DRAFT_1232522 [Mycena haematopus]
MIQLSTASSRAAGRAHIAEIDAKILALRRSIQVLEAEKLRTQEQLNSYTYPVLTLPNEIVSEIFIHFLPVYPVPPPLTGSRSPTTLTHICRTWRNIALTTPALWRAISYPLREDQGQLLRILECWLSRSGCLPLSFLMDSIWDTISGECLDALVPHCARWEFITLAATSETDIFALQGAMPLLQQLEIKAWDDGPPPSPIRFCGTSHLRSVTLWQLSCSTDVLPWSQLTSLTLIYDSIGCSDILQHTVNLVHCHLAFRGDAETVPASNVRLPFLESLVLTRFKAYDDAPAHYLETLITPALRTLEIPEAFLQPHPVDTLDLFTSTSARYLQRLCITGETRSLPESVYRNTFFGRIPELSFDMSLTDYHSYEE